MPRQLKSFWRNSQTKAWSYLQLAGSGVLASASYLNTLVTSPQIKEYLDKIDMPVGIIIALAAIGIITFIAHGHD